MEQGEREDSGTIEGLEILNLLKVGKPDSAIVEADVRGLRGWVQTS
jgi:hypothetical protein